MVLVTRPKLLHSSVFELHIYLHLSSTKIVFHSLTLNPLSQQTGFVIYVVTLWYCAVACSKLQLP